MQHLALLLSLLLHPPLLCVLFLLLNLLLFYDQLPKPPTKPYMSSTHQKDIQNVSGERSGNNALLDYLPDILDFVPLVIVSSPLFLSVGPIVFLAHLDVSP